MAIFDLILKQVADAFVSYTFLVCHRVWVPIVCVCVFVYLYRLHASVACSEHVCIHNMKYSIS